MNSLKHIYFLNQNSIATVYMKKEKKIVIFLDAGKLKMWIFTYK